MNMLAICIPCSSIHHCLSARTVPFAKLFTNETLRQLHIPTAATAKPAQQSLRQLCNASSVDGTVATIWGHLFIWCSCTVCLVLSTPIEFGLRFCNNLQFIHFGCVHFRFKLVHPSFLVTSISLKFSNQGHSHWVVPQHWLLIFLLTVHNLKSWANQLMSNVPSNTTSLQHLIISTIAHTMVEETCFGCHRMFIRLEQHLACNPICSHVCHDWAWPAAKPRFLMPTSMPRRSVGQQQLQQQSIIQQWRSNPGCQNCH